MSKINSILGEYSDWLILSTNIWFSRFGQNALRPLFFLAFFHFIFYYVLTKRFDLGIDITFSVNNHSWSALWQGLGQYLNLVNPVHSSDIRKAFSVKDEVNIFGITDFFMRISSGYFIFYFLKGTRKFSLKG